MVWHSAQVAAGSLTDRRPAAIEAQQFKVFCLQILSPCFGVPAWGEKQVGLLQRMANAKVALRGWGSVIDPWYPQGRESHRDRRNATIELLNKTEDKNPLTQICNLSGG